MTMKLDCENNGKGDHEVQVSSADHCRTSEIEGVGTVELVGVGRLLRMSYESLLLLVWRPEGSGLTGKGELDV